MATNTDKLITLLTQQITMQKEQSDRQQEQQKAQMEQQQAQMEQQMAQQREENNQLIKLLTQQAAENKSGSATPSFTAFDPNVGLWTDYILRFQTFIGANSISEERIAQIFLTNQTTVIYKQLNDWAEQQTPKKEINKLSMNDINTYMMTQYNPRTFIIRERYRFWNNMNRKPGETIQELAARIRHDATTCDFTSITDPQDEALRTRFICSVGNEAILKSLFKIKDGELTFTRAINLAVEAEEAAKETVYGTKNVVQLLHKKKMISTNQNPTTQLP
jgi:hypothetical protein